MVSGQDGEGRPCTWTPRWPPGSTVLALQPLPPKIRVGVELIRPKRSREAAACWRETILESSGCFCRDSVAVFAHLGGCSSCSSTCWCGGRKDGAQPVPSCGEVSRGHVYTSLALGEHLATGQLKNSLLETALSCLQPPPTQCCIVMLRCALQYKENQTHQSLVQKLQPSARMAALVALGSVNTEGKQSQDSQS